jgi:serine/threonine-protein kinase RsbW
VAARAGLTLDRINDVSLIIEALAAHSAPHTPDGRVRVTLRERPGCLTIRLGPLHAAKGGAVLADATLPGLGPVLERLADGVLVDQSGAEEYLEITVGSPAEP